MDVRLAQMRTEYAREGLDEQAAGDDPVTLFRRWLDEAVEAGVPEPNAMTVATATPDGVPSARIVLLKDFDERGAVFFTRYTSRKGDELERNPRAAAVMLWHPLQRQVRIEGRVERLDPADSDAYFASRPRGAQVGAVASPQSRVLAGRGELERLVAETEQAYEGRPVPRPDDWGGYRVVLGRMEFWQGRESRLHDRVVFTRTAGGWDRTRLAP
ncbi:pyridoxamine 5'-phosphate oxidase [Aeromicrobium massiliense]|uniref:pyridoxamine 5'-phosphate oxidase n=1 Tax=Aeromicrobium massiliense TaxID=1464554 RepID=UPI0002E87CA0|nr:pyridoxamine 5'-phosphate oxidase [Aeromicrobium massiliense]